jgi:two-component system chemotaxis response regulator CheY
MFPYDSLILVVDDSNMVRTLLKQQLLSLGYHRTLEAENGKDAIKKMDVIYSEGGKIDLLIVDWNMPEMNGIDFLTVIKKIEKYKKIPFLMMTSESETGSVIKAIVLGVTDYVVKPFNNTILTEKLRGIWTRMNRVSPPPVTQ